MEKQPLKPEETKRDDDLLEQFSIIELEDRLEFETWCNKNCSCPGSP